MYIFKLTVNNESSTLKLLKGDVLVMERVWPEERDMGKQLLLALKTLLDESGVAAEEIQDFVIDGETKENFTSRRIAETVRNVYMFAVTVK